MDFDFKPITPPPDYHLNNDTAILNGDANDYVNLAEMNSPNSVTSSTDSSDDADDLASFKIQDDFDPDAVLVARHPIDYDVINKSDYDVISAIPSAPIISISDKRYQEKANKAAALRFAPIPESDTYDIPVDFEEVENEYDHLIQNVPVETIYYTDQPRHNKLNLQRSESDVSIGSRSDQSKDEDLGQLQSKAARDAFAYYLSKKDAGICIRCHDTVYPAERVGIEVGIMLHKNCFKCDHCDVTLSLNSFVLASVAGSPNKNVFCRSHAPKAEHAALDPDCFEIRNAVHAQRMNKRDSVNGQVRLRATNGWHFDPRAKEFEHIKNIQAQNRVQKRPTYDVKVENKETSENSDVIKQLREGALKRDSVRHLAANMSNAKLVDSEVDNELDFEKCLSQSDLDQEKFEKAESSEDIRKVSEDDEWCRIERREQTNETKLEPLKVVQEGCVLRLKESFQNEAQYQIQHELEMKQRKEQQEMFTRIDQSRQIEAAPIPRESNIERVAPNEESNLSDSSYNIAQPPPMESKSKPTRPNREQEKADPDQCRHFEKVKDEEREIFQEMTDRQTSDMLLLTCNKPLHEFPPPAPPKGRKRDILSEEMLSRIDLRVMQIASYEPQSFTELVYQLTDKCSDDLEKVRAIFRWITLKDLNLVCFEQELNPDSPYFFLKGIKYGLESYHELFRRLCSYAGIPVQIIRGVSKSAGYLPGTPLTNQRFRNIWSAAYINDNWRFIDCHWGARHVDKSRVTTTNGVFCYSLDEFFFITDPEDLIFMHFPDDPKWQLVANPIDIDTFQSFPVVKSTFFHFKLKFIRDCSSIIPTDNGLADVLLRKYSDFDLIFNSRIEHNGEKLNGHCIYQNTDAAVVFHVNLPFAGEYVLTVFACERGMSDVFSNVCSFKLVSTCDVMERNIPSRFPFLPEGYGPLSLAIEYGIETENHRGFYLVTEKEKMILNVKFDVALNVSQKYCKGGEMGENTDIELDRHYFQRYRDNKHVSYLLRFPASGFYVFSLFAGKRGSGSKMLECACRYVIHCTSPSRNHVIKIYPRALQHWIRCRLYEPTHGDLRVNKNVKFKLEAHNATAVAVIVSQQWFYLKQGETAEERARHIWMGVAHTGNSAKHKLQVYARFKGNNKDFFPLLEYKLIDEI